MTLETLQQIVNTTAAEEPVIWQLVFPSLEPPEEEARFLALASLATPDWLPSALACVQLPSVEELKANKDVIDVNWDLHNFLAAWGARQPELVLPALRPLLSDTHRRYFALAVLEEMATFKAAYQELSVLDFLLSYEEQALDWPDVEYEYYTQAFLSGGVEEAVTALEGVLARLPAEQAMRSACLAGQIHHLRNLQAWVESRPSAEEQQRQMAEGLRHLKEQGVLRLIQAKTS